MDADFEGEPFINYICSGSIDSRISLSDTKLEVYKERVDLNFIDSDDYESTVKDLTKIETVPGDLNWMQFT